MEIKANLFRGQVVFSPVLGNGPNSPVIIMIIIVITKGRKW